MRKCMRGVPYWALRRALPLAASDLLTVFAVDQVKCFAWLASWLPAEPASITTCTSPIYYIPTDETFAEKMAWLCISGGRAGQPIALPARGFRFKGWQFPETFLSL